MKDKLKKLAPGKPKAVIGRARGRNEKKKNPIPHSFRDELFCAFHVYEAYGDYPPLSPTLWVGVHCPGL